MPSGQKLPAVPDVFTIRTISWLWGGVAAFVYDTEEGAAPTMQLLEYANAQLLEFRHYDDLLTGVLENVYKMLEHKGGLMRHWKMARQAEKAERDAPRRY